MKISLKDLNRIFLHMKFSLFVKNHGMELKNGELLKLLLENNFDALLTFDKNLQHQQNFQKYTITVFVMSAKMNTYEELTNLTPIVENYLNKDSLPVGAIVIKI